MRLLQAIEQDLITWALGELGPILPRHLGVGRIERLTRRQIVDYLRDQFGVEARSSWRKAELVGLLEDAVNRRRARAKDDGGGRVDWR